MTRTNYEDFGGTLTFAAGTESGTTQDVTVSTTATTGADVSRSVVVALTATGAQPPAIDPVVVINAHGLPYPDPELPVSKRVSDLMGG